MAERTLRILEYTKIRDLLARETLTAMGRERAEALVPAADPATVRERLTETTEAVRLLEAGDVPLRGARDLRPALREARIGGILDPGTLLNAAQTLQVARHLRGFLITHRGQAPGLSDAAERITPLEGVEQAILAVLDDEGQVRDDASPTLRGIRMEQRTLEQRIRERVEAVIRSPVYARMLQEPLITMRGERFVVPVRVEARAQFPGLVHDQSSSGATVFMEPLVIVPMGNRRRELEAMERAEIQRLLAELSQRLAAEADAIEGTLDALGDVDLALAKAGLSRRWQCAEPRVVEDGALDLRGARHPLLRPREGEPVVPIDVLLGGDFRTLVITGPNTGGKTVTLKTIGLLTLMGQAGLHVPASDGSVVRVFPAVYADIGDEQSIEQNLSTFSSHMRAIVDILARVASPALVLLDEIGAGTDPTEGTALARAIIETLHGRGVCTAVTTHYNELKALAHVMEGVANASVEFDPETLQPTFRLLVGRPGRSNALIIAGRLGLEADLVDRARSFLSREQLQAEALLADLARDQAAAARERQEAEHLRREAEALAERGRAEAERMREERRAATARTRQEAEAWFRQARREVEALLLEARRAGTRQAAEAARRRLEEFAAEWAKGLGEAEEPLGPPLEAVKIGQVVQVPALGRTGRVVGGPDGHGEVEVEVGAARARVPLSSLRPAPAPLPGRSGDPATVTIPAAVSSSLSVRGKTVDDALLDVDRYLDEAILAALPRVTVIHGKGTGALRSAIHAFLRGHPHVRAFRAGDRGEGGDGVTVIDLTT